MLGNNRVHDEKGRMVFDFLKSYYNKFSKQEKHEAEKILVETTMHDDMYVIFTGYPLKVVFGDDTNIIEFRCYLDAIGENRIPFLKYSTPWTNW